MGKIWVPKVVVRPLLPPPPSVGARLQPQHMHWQLGRYKEDLTFGPGGCGRRKRWVVDREAEQHNLVLNQTYDTLIGQFGFVTLNDYAVVGTRAALPSAVQTSLAKEVKRTNRDPNGNTGTRTIARQADGIYTVQVVREFLPTEVGNTNLTEWGFSPVGNAGNNLMSRELFRDSNGARIVITPASDQYLRLIYTIRIQLGPVGSAPVNASIDITGLGTYSGKAFVSRFSESGGSYGDLWLVHDWARGWASTSSSDGLTVVALTSYTPPSYDARFSEYSPSRFPGKRINSASMYSPIARGRKINPITWGPGEENRTWYGVAVVRYSGLYLRGGFALAFDDGISFTKSELYRLTIGEWTLTWGP